MPPPLKYFAPKGLAPDWWQCHYLWRLWRLSEVGLAGEQRLLEVCTWELYLAPSSSLWCSLFSGCHDINCCLLPALSTTMLKFYAK